MDNNKVQLKTIINEDGTTTFLVLRPDGEYTVLTWSDISNKPFNSINDLQFIVVDGVLKIRDTTLSKSWREVTDKPFITLSPTDFEVVNNELRYKGIPSWNEVTDKPFNSVNSDDFDTSGGILKLAPKQPETVGWIDVQSKPFESVSNSDFNVVGNELQIRKEGLSIDWSQIASKPFNQVGDGLKVENNTLKADIDISNTWSQVKDKPFTSIGTGLSVDGSGVLSAQGGQGGTTIYSAPLSIFLTEIKDTTGNALVLNGFTPFMNLNTLASQPTIVTPDNFQNITISQIRNSRLINCPCFNNDRFEKSTNNYETNMLGIQIELDVTGTVGSENKEFTLYCDIQRVNMVKNNNTYTLSANVFIYDKGGKDDIFVSNPNFTINLNNNFMTIVFMPL